MRPLNLSRGLVANVLVLATALAVLVFIYFWVPRAFTVALAIGGLIGAVVVLYEVRLTKRIAQAEFIRLLNDGFVGDSNTTELWRKLLVGESIGQADRHLTSAYLTFFETLRVLMGRGVIDFALVDDLFRNRFFRAVGNPGIQSTALLAQRESFVNVHHLLEDWRKYLRSKRIRLPDGYYSYASARLAAEGFDLQRLAGSDLEDLLALQDDVLAHIQGPSLRTNSPETFRDCLENQFVLGARREGRLVAAGILLDVGQDDENIQTYLTQDSDVIQSSCNLKLVLVAPSSRGFGVAKLMVEQLEREASLRGHRHILCTIHPKNKPSQRLFRGLGYRRRKRVVTSYGVRYVFEFDLPAPLSTRRWAIPPSSVTPEVAAPQGSRRRRTAANGE